MGKIKWNDRMIAVLRELYPVETNAYTAGVLGMSDGCQEQGKGTGHRQNRQVPVDGTCRPYQQPFPYGLLFGNGKGTGDKQDECLPDCRTFGTQTFPNGTL